jgi:hypothetical protein
MTGNDMETPKTILELVERFEAHRDIYTSSEYNEAQVRQEFINPFFEALGWDVQNKKGFAEPYKEVVHEDAIKVGGATKAPDYSFRLGGRRLFFLEAKKPAVNITDDPSPAYQLRRYAWTAKLPVSILTDFEDLIVYDTRVKPAPNDKASTARVLCIHFKEYPARWDELAALFSPQAIQKGALDKYVQSTGKKRGTAEVDDAFLAEIEEWRDLLARNIALRNPDLDQRGLNDAVQRTIDRIIFLRLCEDRGIEEYARLQALLSGTDTYNRLTVLFREADDRYNSGLFHFRPEKGRPDCDRVTLGLAIDDKVLKDVIRDLYYPESPYEFSVLPADILGQVYEQFLGKVIRLTKGHQAKVEEKPEVRKAGGVYYTPTYIVDYIVKHTVGKLLENKRPKDIDGSRKNAPPLCVLDPACGSGSFLIAAYQYLLDWYRDRYVKEGPESYCKGRNPRLYQGRNGQYALTALERKRILLDHIYGVDIDTQAVEVTKLSLLLKVLESENAETLGKTLALFHQRALPDLDSNIKCGNSLIGPDFYHGKQTEFDEEETYRINAFDWNAEFPQIMQTGGFDAVIGNPPYIRIQTMKEWAPVEVEFYKQRYRAAAAGNYDIYVVFIEKGLSLLNENGRLGFICPHKFFTARYGEGIRQIINGGKHLEHLVHFGDQQVFSGATTYTCLLFLTRESVIMCDYRMAGSIREWQANGVADDAPARWRSERDAKAHGRAPFLDRFVGSLPRLGELCHTFVGTQTSADDVFVLTNCRQRGNLVSGFSKASDSEVSVERKVVVPFLRGKDIRRYAALQSTSFLICPYSIGESECRLLSPNEIASFRRTWEYLNDHKDRLQDRERGKLRGTNWYAFGYPKSMTLFNREKIVVPDYNNEASFTSDKEGFFYKTGYGIVTTNDALDMTYLLALLNSKLLFQFLLRIGTCLRGGYVRFWSMYLEQLPIRTIDFSDAKDKARHDKMVSLVQRMLHLHKRLQTVNTEHERTLLQRQITTTDVEIDHLVYELYDLTDEEIAIVEESIKK